MVTEKEIQDITDIIVQTVKPKQVYLIGSYATGRAHEGSDVDFLIVSDNEQLPKYERTGVIQKKLLHYPDFPIDLIMFSTREIETKKHNELSFIGQALKTSKLLYEA